MLLSWLTANLTQLCWCWHNSFCLTEQLGNFHKCPIHLTSNWLNTVLPLSEIFILNYSITTCAGLRHSLQNLAWLQNVMVMVGSGELAHDFKWGLRFCNSATALAMEGGTPTEEKGTALRARVQASAKELHRQPGRVRTSLHGHILSTASLWCNPLKISSITDIYEKKIYIYTHSHPAHAVLWRIMRNLSPEKSAVTTQGKYGKRTRGCYS